MRERFRCGTATGALSLTHGTRSVPSSDVLTMTTLTSEPRHRVEPAPSLSDVVPSGDLVARRRQVRRLAALSCLVVAIVHVWIISAGWMTYWPRYTRDYSLLGDAFAH